MVYKICIVWIDRSKVDREIMFPSHNIRSQVLPNEINYQLLQKEEKVLLVVIHLWKSLLQHVVVTPAVVYMGANET